MLQLKLEIKLRLQLLQNLAEVLRQIESERVPGERRMVVVFFLQVAHQFPTCFDG